ncbi:DUF4384 domain-containing protein [Pelagimonas varians]|uniref:DUF4384 domain-containing protein n=1 Tax=Pelagimonas varians TaxID=696760 RepID=A0A238JSU3_9RHOB|nr:DUF4384 domain-containing protein [Pelagimonas varians]PYG34516.1 uncharacterized protein DUF4384 [Pelagimonas varians]SMX33748.1 hypothetical protein PEV8663_00299 [Pelagimonas varians]
MKHPARETLNLTLRLALVSLTLMFAAMSPAAAQTPEETALSSQLAALVRFSDMPTGSRIALAPPPPMDSALPMAQVEAIMSRVAQLMVADWPAKPRILAGSADLRSTLALVRGRQGQEAWTQAISTTLRQEAEFVLVGETGIGAGSATLRLTLVALSDGRVLAKTSDVPVSTQGTAMAATPRGGITQAVAQLQQSVPQARDQITIGAFVNERSGFETPLGQALSDITIEAWFSSAQSITAMIQDARAPRVLRGAAPPQGFYLSGTIRLIDADRFQLVLRLSDGPDLLATRTLDLSALQLAPHLRAGLDPRFEQGQSGFEPLLGLIQGIGPARMELQTLGGREDHYPICKTSDFNRLLTACPDSLIQLSVTTDRPGQVMCFSIDDAGSLSVIVPNAYTAAPWVLGGQNLLMPDDLPPLPDGTRMYWPAMGPASQTLVACLLFEGSAVPLADAMTALEGPPLSAALAYQLMGTIRDSAPLASSGQVVKVQD